MIIVKISGGLGNQIYQYALYRKFQSLGIEAKMSLEYFRNKKILKSVPGHSVKYLLGDIFSGVIELFSSDEEDKVFKKFSTNSILRQFARNGFVPNLVIEDVRGSSTNYDPNVLKLKKGFVDGYWQSMKYSADIIDILRKELSFKKPLEGENAEIAVEIEKTNSVSIHVRRGDYVNTEYELLGNGYYKKAIEVVREKISDPKFFIFSDDIGWCKENLGIEGTYITWNKKDDSYIDMQLMSLCKVNIVANSTFSIWAASLNGMKDHLVIHPYKYYKFDVEKKDRWPEEWVEIVY